VKKLLVLSFVLFVVSCGGSSGSDPIVEPPPPPPEPPVINNIDTLWKNTVSEMLSSPLWQSDYNYDAAHVLMLPLHFAFSTTSEQQKQQEFEAFFQRYADLFEQAIDDNRLRQLQYHYLVSQYLLLANDFTPELGQLADAMSQYLIHQWTQVQTQTWGSPAIRQFENGMQERLNWKLSNEVAELEFAKAIIDEEFYALAVAADLKAFYQKYQMSYDTTLDTIVETTYQVFSQKFSAGDDYFYVQKGVWSHHFDYRYAGHVQQVADLEEKTIDDIAVDSSHLHRMPLWLKSFALADPERQVYWNGLFNRLKLQFERVILVMPDESFPGPRLNNYSDGRNGLYRYNFPTVANNLGYGPYELSGTLMHSWYAFLGSSSYKTSLNGMSFPLAEDVQTLYIGPGTTRQRHPVVEEYLTNGFAELYTLLAVK